MKKDTLLTIRPVKGDGFDAAVEVVEGPVYCLVKNVTIREGEPMGSAPLVELELKPDANNKSVDELIVILKKSGWK